MSQQQIPIVNVTTISTKKFRVNASAAGGLTAYTCPTPDKAARIGIQGLIQTLRECGSSTDARACLVQWFDGDALHAFIQSLDEGLDDEAPLPWVVVYE